MGRLVGASGAVRPTRGQQGHDHAGAAGVGDLHLRSGRRSSGWVAGSRMSTMLKDPTPEWTKAHINHIVQNRLPETARLEYKREMSLDTPRAKKEAAKDVSSMANSSGGRMIIGIKEEQQADGSRLPVGVQPITDGGLAKQLEDVLLSNTQPDLGPLIHPVEVDGGYCVVIDVEPSVMPVMVTSGGDNRYYKRVNFQAVPMDEREVRERYERSTRSLETAQRLIEEAVTFEGLTVMEKADFCAANGWDRSPAWLALVAAPFFPSGEVFDGAMGRLQLSALGDKYWGDTAVEPHASGLELRLGERPPYLLLRAHRNGVIELHEYFHGRDLTRQPPTQINALQEATLLRHYVLVIARLFEYAVYLLGIEIRAEYHDVTGFALVGDGHLRESTISTDPPRFMLRTTPAALVRDPDLVVVPLLDRVWQAAGTRRCEPLHTT